MPIPCFGPFYFILLLFLFFFIHCYHYYFQVLLCKVETNKNLAEYYVSGIFLHTSKAMLSQKTLTMLSNAWKVILYLFFASASNKTDNKYGLFLTLKVPNKNCSRRHFNFLFFEENKASFFM